MAVALILIPHWSSANLASARSSTIGTLLCSHDYGPEPETWATIDRVIPELP